ncbi:AAA domain-containing protein [Paraclostridium tenue]|uniref:Protein kinase domain-containing protein n=1 Tax=Paraclostridium tenue TaxID=1737 RepID=A0ABP3XEA4_9FIRM
MKILEDRYILIKKISENQSSSIELYLGRDSLTDNAIAIKVFDLGENKEGKLSEELFKREYQSLKKLSHKSIVKYINSGKDKNKLFLVMEYLEHKTLKEYINNEQVLMEDKINIAISIVEAIAFAHEKGVIHRDLNPKNIMINNPKDIRIIDFGISKILSHIYNDENTVKCYMTINYASPEQLLREDVRTQSDIYSLGLTLSYLFSENDPPGNKKEIEKYISNIRVSENIKNLLMDMTRYDINERSESIYEIKRILQKELLLAKSKTQRLYIKCNSYIQRKLIELGMITYNGEDHTIKFLKEDLTSSSIYKNKKTGNYCLIGSDVKYICTLDSSKNFLDIKSVHCLEDHIEWNNEINRGFKIDLPWIPIYNNLSQINDSFIENLIQQVADKERERDVEKSRSSAKGILLEKWNKYLQEEFKDVDEKRNLGKYKNFEINDTGYKIDVYLTDEELSSELQLGDMIQLTDKKNHQITVGEFEDINKNIITIKLDSEVNPSDVSNMGTIGIDVSKSINSLRKFGRALNAINTSSCVNPYLPDIIADPSLIEINEINHIDREQYFQDILKKSNSSASLNAVEKALATKDLFLIQGPPGTGKTTVITEIVCQILKDEPDGKILLASQSHVAVDNVVTKVAELLPDKRIIRIGRSEKISEQSKNLIMSEQLNRWVENVKKTSRKALKQYVTNCIGNSQNVEKIQKITEEWHRRLGKLDEFDEIFAEGSSIVASTCLGIASRNILNYMDFDWVIVDEAARATPLELLVPIVRGKKIILVGDHRQLPPVINTKVDKIRLEEKGIKEVDLEKSLFEDMYDKMTDKPKSILTSQFRMHPDISRLVSDIFYPAIEIETGISKNNRNHMLEWWPKTIKWIDTSLCKDKKEKDENLSKKNDAEAKAILNQLENIESSYRKDGINNITVSVISGYNEQKKLLINLIKPNDKNRWKSIRIFIDNVDAFQGSETDIVIYSLVRNNDDFKIGFLYDDRRLNVALSRGKKCLIIVGDIKFAKKAKSFRGNPFTNVIKFIEKNSKSCLIEVYDEN